MQITKLFLILFFSVELIAQQKYSLFINEVLPGRAEHIFFKANFPVGQSEITTTYQDKLIVISGNCTNERLKPELKENIVQLPYNTLTPDYINVILSKEKEKQFSSVNHYIDLIFISTDGKIQSFESSTPYSTTKYTVMEVKGITEHSEDVCKIQLKNNKTYTMKLNYGLGKSKLNFSDIAIKNLFLHTANSDVELSYPDKPNQVEMDTMNISVGMADFSIINMQRARVKNMLVDAGFGSVVLNFTDKCETKCKVTAELGAGKMKVLLPVNSIPVIVRFNGTFFSSFYLPDNFKKVKPGIYVNEKYFPNAPDLLIFDIDISMGSIVFLDNSKVKN